MGSQTKPIDGGPAFPCPLPHSDEGITIRDYFAAKALPQIMREMLDEHAYIVNENSEFGGGTGWGMPHLGETGEASWAAVAAAASYEIADAMLIARQKAGDE